MRWIFLLLLFLLHLGCESSPTAIAGGSAVEGETVNARILDARGNPLAGSIVLIRAIDPPGWSVRSTTDADGRLAVRIPAGTVEIVLEIADPSDPAETLSYRLPIRPGLDTTLQTPRWPTLHGTVGAPPGWVATTLEVEGLGIRVAVLEGTYAIEHVPPGTWSFVLQADSASVVRRFPLGEATIASDEPDQRQDFTPRSNRIVLADFDSTPAQVRCTDGDGISDDTLPTCHEAATGTAAWSGSSLRLHLQGRPSAPRVAWIGFDAKETSTWRATATDTVSIMLRGTGLFRLSLVADSSSMSFDSSTSQEILASPGWTLHRFPVSALLAPSALEGPLSGLGIESEEEVWIVLDEIVLVADPR